MARPSRGGHVTVRQAPGPRVRAAGITVAALTIGFLFITSILGAYHAPTPHDVPIAIVGPVQVTAQVRAALNQRDPGAFDLVSYRSAAAATHEVEYRDAYAALVVPASGTTAGKDRAQLIIASGIGADPAEVIRTVFTEAAAAAGTTAAVRDIAPLPPGDPLGVSPYFFCVALYLPSFLLGIMLTFAAPRASTLSKIMVVLVFAALLGIVEVAVADGLTGALIGHAVALAGMGMLTALAFGAAVTALGRVLGAVGIGLSTLTFLIAGIPSSGGPFGVSFLPAFYRVVGPVLPLTNAATVARNISYFHGHAIRAPLGVLAVWAGGGLLILIAVALLENRVPHRLRKAPSGPAAGHGDRSTVTGTGTASTSEG
jgi:hypothetical protein